MTKFYKHKGIRLTSSKELSLYTEAQIQKKYNLSIEKLYNTKEWEGYRLGDAIRGFFKENVFIPSHIQKYPHSIVATYFSKTKKFMDLKLLNDIIQSSPFCLYKSPPNTCAMHLRTGDVFRFTTTDKEKAKRYIYSLSYYKNHVIPQLRKNNIRQIVIITGSHQSDPKCLEKSLQYIIQVIHLFLLYDFNVQEIKMGNPPDNDFVFMSTSRYFIQSGGGFSSLIAMMVKYNNNICIHKLKK